MDLDLSARDLAFRDEVRAFLSRELTPELRAAGRAATSIFSHPRHSLAWQRILHARGWAAPDWPVAYGGPGWTDAQRYIFAAECAAAGAPPLAPMGLKMVAPCIMQFGTPEQKARDLPRILSGEDYWCQGYSEPGAGSDLAALALRADDAGDDYILSGSKIWTTHAQFANRMFCLVRTRVGGKPQAGITFILLDMASPGVSVRPIITLAGDHEVNQVFFNEVRVPKSNRLGAEDDGWTVAKHLLEFERGGASGPMLRALLQRVVQLAAHAPSGGGGPLLSDAGFRGRLAALEIAVLGIETTELRVISALSAGQSPGAASSMLKTQATEAMQAIDALAVEAAGHAAAFAGAEPESPDRRCGRRLMARYLNDRAATIYGGSNEIQRNIMARLVLGL